MGNRLLIIFAAFAFVVLFVFFLIPFNDEQSTGINDADFKTYFTTDGRFVYETVPVDLVKNQSDSNYYLKTHLISWPKTGFVRFIKPEVVGPEGAVLHHSVLANTTKKDSVCPAYGGEVFFAAGEELTLFDTQEGYGYLISKGDKISVDTHLFGTREYNLKNVFLRLQFEFAPIESKNIPVQPIYITEPSCAGDPSFLVAPTKNLIEKKLDRPVIAPFSGELIDAGGHLHTWGQSLKLFKNDKLVYDFKPKTDEQGKIIKMPVLARPGLQIKKGDILSTTALYRNPTGRIIDGMSILLLLIHKTD